MNICVYTWSVCFVASLVNGLVNPFCLIGRRPRVHGATGRVTADLVRDLECQSCEEGNLSQVLYQVSSVHPCASAHRNIIWTTVSFS